MGRCKEVRRICDDCLCCESFDANPLANPITQEEAEYYFSHESAGVGAMISPQ